MVNLDIDCLSGLEKGGIYHKGYYYTSCKTVEDSFEFNVKIYKKDGGALIYCQTITSTEAGCQSFKDGSSIRFFKMISDEELIGVAWRSDSNFCLLILKGCEEKTQKHYSKTRIAKDIDCIYINKYQRIVCGFGFLKTDDEYKPYINLFNGVGGLTGEFSSIKDGCGNHHTRKLRVFSNDPENSHRFYYYYIDTNNVAYVVPMALESISQITTGNIYKIMTDCEQIQSSYDISEDKFMGYNVFVCVANQYPTRIKVHLFKIENGEISFYKGDENTPFYTFQDPSNAEISMVNFIVLKETLNFGFLSYRIDDGARYTLFNQPKCYSFPKDDQNNRLGLNTDLVFDFEDNTYNDDFGDVDIIIVEPRPPGIYIEPRENSKIYVKSTGDASGEITFIFKISNGIYESEECTAKINVIGCHKNCKTCDSNSDPEDFTRQYCNTCKEDGYYFIENYPELDNSKNCCKEGVDCPDYFYFDGIDKKYKICDISCLKCKGPGPENCETCNNEKELENYSSEDKRIIKGLKVTTIQYYWNNEKQEKCADTPEPKYYLNDTLSSFMPCYRSCGSCKKGGNELSHNCDTCDVGYYKYLNVYTSNCYLKEEKESNLYSDIELNTDFSTEENVLKQCSELCSKCEGPNDNQCTKCTFDSFPECDHGETFKCFKSARAENYYFDIEEQCWGECYSSCASCDNKPDIRSHNCLSCADELIFYNKNCVHQCSEIGSSLYNLEDKTCVNKCPIYTVAKEVDGKNLCYNCKSNDLDDKRCIYIGSKGVLPCGDENEKCCVRCESDFVFRCNDEYNILDDCYDACRKCKQSGTVEKMNCEICKNNEDCLVEGPGNCIPKDENRQIDYYYRDTTDGCKYLKCYENCKSCYGPGNSLNHNCITCKENYQFDPNNPGNCVEICQFYWYVDPQTNSFTCTKEEKCPDNLPYLVEINNGCVQECSAAFHNDNDEKFTFFYRYKNTCVTKCPENSIRDSLLYACHSLDQVEDVFTYVSNYISQGTYADNLLTYSNKKYFTLFNTTKEGIEAYERTAIKVGTSIIDLSNCISTLKQIYTLNENEVFYVGLLDVIRDDTSAPQFEYTIHNHYGTKLDINYCINNELTIKKSLNQSNNISLAKNILAEYGYDIIDYNKDNPFFCDICSTFDYDGLDSYDVLLNDRYKYYYENQDYYFCEDNYL